jgi:tetratricopeptide (TPR) repeat protein
VAKTLPGLGPAEIAPLVNRDFDLGKARLGQEEYFVLTRIDGRTSLRELILISGFPEGQALTILRRLRQVGAMYFPGEDPARPPPPELDFDSEPPRPPAQIDEAILAEDVDLTDEQKRVILTKYASLAGGTYFSVLEVHRDAGKKALRAARDKISMRFHPDRPAYFKKRLGSYRSLLAQIFEIANEAFEVLSDDARRETYVLGLVAARNGVPVDNAPASDTGPVATRSPSDRQRAADLFEEACHHQVTGELPRALTEFASAISLDPQPRYLRRAAQAALRAQELRDAEEYGKRAAELDPQNAESHRVYGRILRARGRLDEAHRALEEANRLDPGNPHIAAELRALMRPNGPEGDHG